MLLYDVFLFFVFRFRFVDGFFSTATKKKSK